MQDREPAVRYSSRALIVDHEDRVLLAQHEISEGVVWVGPGGGVEDGESLTEALARELFEEAGLTLRPDADTTLVWVQRHDFGFAEWRTIQNHFFMLRSDDFDGVDITSRTEFPMDPGLVALRWWTLAEIDEAARDPAVLFSPRAFPELWPDLLSRMRRGEVPDHPIVLGL